MKNYDEVGAVCKQVYEDFGSIDFLVCSAGGSARSKCATLANQSIEIINDIIGVNLFGALYFNKACAAYMMKKGFGRIVNIASIVAL